MSCASRSQNEDVAGHMNELKAMSHLAVSAFTRPTTWCIVLPRDLLIGLCGFGAGRTDPGKPFDNQQAGRGAGPVPTQSVRPCGPDDGAQDKGNDNYIVGAADHRKEVRDKV